jgi:hypothetical protein
MRCTRSQPLILSHPMYRPCTGSRHSLEATVTHGVTYCVTHGVTHCITHGVTFWRHSMTSQHGVEVWYDMHYEKRVHTFYSNGSLELKYQWRPNDVIIVFSFLMRQIKGCYWIIYSNACVQVYRFIGELEQLGCMSKCVNIMEHLPTHVLAVS